jgi:hypothetical protein
MAHTIQLIAANRYLPCQYTVKHSLHQFRRPTMSGIVLFCTRIVDGEDRNMTFHMHGKPFVRRFCFSPRVVGLGNGR